MPIQVLWAWKQFILFDIYVAKIRNRKNALKKNEVKINLVNGKINIFALWTCTWHVKHSFSMVGLRARSGVCTEHTACAMLSAFKVSQDSYIELLKML